MRNPNRTTKRERRAVRRYNRYAVRALGVAEAARWHRRGILLAEAEGFEHMLGELFPGTRYDRAPADLTPNCVHLLGLVEGDDAANIGAGTVPVDPAVRERAERLLAAAEANTRYTESVGHTVEADGWGNLKYPTHISVGYHSGAHQADAMIAMFEAAAEGPAESMRGRLERALDLPEGILDGPSIMGIIREQHDAERDALAAWAERYRAPLPDEARDVIAEVGLDPDDYAYGHATSDPFEVDALHAEAIERALDEDYDDE